MTQVALVIVDMQKAYFRNADLEARREELTRACNELILQAVQTDVPVFGIVTKHRKDRSTWTLNMLDDGEGYLFEGEGDVELVEGLRLRDALEIVKTRDSAFFDTRLAEELKRRNIETVVLAGVSTHTCIFQTAADAYAHNVRVVLAEDAIATHDPQLHTVTLDLLNQEYRQPTRSNKDILMTLLAEAK